MHFLSQVAATLIPIRKQGDVIASLAKQNGQLLRGHNCVWYNQLASWVTAGNFNATELTSILQTHCGTVVRILQLI